MELPTETKRRPSLRRRFTQFSLRGLLLLIAICSVWLGFAFHRARQQAQIVRFLESRDSGSFFDSGIVFYDFNEVEPDSIDDDVTSHVPNWLLEILGVDFFHNVTRVILKNATNDDLQVLSNLSKVRGLYLGNSSISNEGLAALKNLSELRSFSIGSAKIDNQGLRELAAIRTLRKLDLVDVNIDDRGRLCRTTSQQRRN